MTHDGRLDRGLASGTVLVGSRGAYRITEYIGGGGVAHAWLAELVPESAGTGSVGSTGVATGTGTGQCVVVKVPRADPRFGESGTRDRLERCDISLRHEERTLRLLEGVECVAAFVDSGQLPQDAGVSPELHRLTFLVQQFVGDEDLRRHVQRITRTDPSSFKGVRSTADWFRWALRLARGLREVHQVAVHNDLWPDNVRVDADGRVYFIDFGEGGRRADVQHPLDPELVRNHAYLAPELRNGRRGFPSRRADIYSFGMVLLWLATGQEQMFEKPLNPDGLKAWITELLSRENPCLFYESAGVADVLAHCLRWDREQRIRDCDTLLDMLISFAPSACGALPVPDLSELGELRERVDAHPLFGRWMNFELAALLRCAHDLANGMLNVVGERESIVAGVTRYLSVLEEGDEYLAVTIPQFWSERNAGLNGRYISMNLELARRGVVVRRVFLIDRRDIGSERVNKLLLKHQAVRELLPPERRDNFKVRFKLIDAEEIADVVRRGEHCGVWIKKGSAVHVTPIYDDAYVIRVIRIRQAEADPDVLRAEFERRFDCAAPIDKWDGESRWSGAA